MTAKTKTMLDWSAGKRSLCIEREPPSEQVLRDVDYACRLLLSALIVVVVPMEAMLLREQHPHFAVLVIGGCGLMLYGIWRRR